LSKKIKIIVKERIVERHTCFVSDIFYASCTLLKIRFKAQAAASDSRKLAKMKSFLYSFLFVFFLNTKRTSKNGFSFAAGRIQNVNFKLKNTQYFFHAKKKKNTKQGLHNVNQTFESA
jgi:hypothetical protein